jgi:predicted esterase
MWITPLPPSLTAFGGRSHGSILNGNYLPNRLSSAWKPTGYDVTLKTFPDVGHTISPEEAGEAALFLRERFK